MSANKFEPPLIGQTCVIRGGGATKGYIGRVVDWVDRFPHQSIAVEHPISGAVTHYAPHNVELIPCR